MQQLEGSDPTRYTVDRERVGAVEIVRLVDRVRPAEALVAPALGANCLSFRIGGAAGPWDVLAAPPDADELTDNYTRYGIPVLLPFPNRVRDGEYTVRGRVLRMDPNTPQGHHNHGLVRDRAWTVVGFGTDAGAWVHCRLRADEHPDILRQYPFPFQVDIVHRLAGDELRIETVVENLGAETMPMGFGLHPFIALPLGPDGRRERCEVRVPARRYWELDRNLPTGALHPVGGDLDLRRFRALGSHSYDDVFTDLEDEGGVIVAAVRDPAGRRVVEVRADPAFREFVLYAPLDRPVVALEPYTCPTDAVNLEARGIRAGLLHLEPGQRWSGAVTIRARENRVED